MPDARKMLQRLLDQPGRAETVDLADDLDGLTLPGAEAVLALTKNSPWWLGPVVGKTVADVPEGETMLLLWRREDRAYGVALALSHHHRRAFLTGREGQLAVRVIDGGTSHDPEPLLVVAGGKDPYAIIEAAWQQAAERLGTLQLREDKPAPAFLDRFGWCTWDAFYQEVTEDKLLQGLQTLADVGIPPGFVILDDGWQDVRDSLLWSFGTHPQRFPGGLAGMIGRARSDFGVEHFGVWHTLQGYWAGVHPDGPAAREPGLRILDFPDKGWYGRNWRVHHGDRRCLVHPDDADRFFDTYHAALADAGVNFVKVDNQGSLESFGGAEALEAPTAAAYQNALQTSAAKHFDRGLIHCMCHTNAVLCHLHTTNCFRNSDDFYPKKPWMHGLHFRNNAFNALWVGPVAVPDWDMFHSKHPAALAHAAARAISGGPVYISDKPGEHDANLVRRLLISGSRVLRNDSPALPAASCLFDDPLNEPKPLKLINRHGDCGVIGLFHCQWTGEKTEAAVNQAGTLRGQWSSDDVPSLEGDRFACWSPITRKLTVLHAGQRVDFELDPLGCDLLHLAPIRHRLAPLGLIEKLNSTRALQSVRQNDGTIEFELVDGGVAGVFAEHAPAAVTVDGNNVDWDYDPQTRLLTVWTAEGKSVMVRIESSSA